MILMYLIILPISYASDFMDFIKSPFFSVFFLMFGIPIVQSSITYIILKKFASYKLSLVEVFGIYLVLHIISYILSGILDYIFLSKLFNSDDHIFYFQWIISPLLFVIIYSVCKKISSNKNKTNTNNQNNNQQQNL